MFEAKFKLKHTGCWTIGLADFKSEFCTHITVGLTKDFVQDITEVFLANKSEAQKIKNYFARSKVISKWSVLEETDRRLIIQIFTDTSKIKSVVHVILKNNCFVSKKILLVDGSEVWTIAAPIKNALKHALDEIKELGELKILRLRTSTFDGINLSEQQEVVLKYASAHGYYSWPRKISAQELAIKLKLKKSTVLEHLRKAEIKVINRDFGV